MERKSRLEERARRQRSFIFRSGAEFERVRRENIYDAHHIFPQLEEIIDYLKNFKLYRKGGVSFDCGVLFYGPAGTGKTLFAKFVATESGACFVDVRKFPVELKSGVHLWQAEDVSNLFKFGRERVKANDRPIVFFVDQLDNFLKAHQNIVDQLEIELDGFYGRPEGIFVIATSQQEEPSGSLFRGGRIGLSVAFSLPDKKQQIGLLNGFLNEYSYEEGIDAESLVYLLGDSSPATLKFNVEDAHFLAEAEYKRNKSKGITVTTTKPLLTEKHLARVFLQKVLSPPTGHTLSPEDKLAVAIHEVGHYVVARAWGLPAHYVSVRPGLKSLGETFLKENVSGMVSIFDAKILIAHVLGGAAVLGQLGYPDAVNSGEDLEAANDIAETLISEAGYRKILSKKYGLVNISSDASTTSERARYDLERKERRCLLRWAKKVAVRTLKFFGKDLVRRVSEVLAAKSEGVMLRKELDNLLEPKLSEFHRLHKVRDKVKR